MRVCTVGGWRGACRLALNDQGSIQDVWRTFHVNISSCVCGPAEQFAGGSLLRSFSSFMIGTGNIRVQSCVARFSEQAVSHTG